MVARPKIGSTRSDRPTERGQFEEHAYGDDLALVEREEAALATVAVPGSVRRAKTKAAPERELGDITVNTKAGVQLRFAALGPLEAPYRWNLDDADELTLDLNTDHKLYKEADRQGAAMHPSTARGWSHLRSPSGRTRSAAMPSPTSSRRSLTSSTAVGADAAAPEHDL